ncbi:MAG: DUF3419 family protein, partial [Synechococcaceae cyanobacterium]|nr:DUF3419 family protein [Synechococcaceae cyanobacterium]
MEFPTLGYANCWEDGLILCEALRPDYGKRILSIASGGDNSFIMAAQGATVIAADRNPSQIACVQLKKTAIRRLDYEDLMGFLGFNPSNRRLEIFRQLEPFLSDKSRAYWNGRLSSIEEGFAHSGKFEGYFRKFCRYIVPLIHQRPVVLDLLKERSRAEREQFYENQWNNIRWRTLLKLFFNRVVMARLGRESSYFDYVEGSMLDHVMDCAYRGMVELPTHDNPFLEYIATGTFKNSLPP